MEDDSRDAGASATQGAVAELALLGWLLGGGSGVVWATVTGNMVLVLPPPARLGTAQA